VNEDDYAKRVSDALHWVVEHRKLPACKKLHHERELFFGELTALETDRPDLAADANALRRRVEQEELLLATGHAELLGGGSDEAGFLRGIDACADAIIAARTDVAAARAKPKS
jgi:hypothetical protein